MTHDLVAELQGYNNELAREENRGRGERADAVREQIARVRAEISDRADQLEIDSMNFTEQGQDLNAAQAAIDARKLRAELEAAGPFPAPVDTQQGQDPVDDPATDDGKVTDKYAAGGALNDDTGLADVVSGGDNAHDGGIVDGAGEADTRSGTPPLETTAETKPARTAGRKKAGS